MKNQYIAGTELPKGRWVRTLTVCKFKRGLGEKDGVVFFRGGDIPMHTMGKGEMGGV